MTKRPDMMLWLNDRRGIYIPRDFALSFNDRAKQVTGVSDDEWAVLEAGPDHERYWDTWVDVEDNAIVTDEHGVKRHIHQDGDVWLIPEGMEWSDDEETYVWPERADSD
jgi:hypothetical protein